MCKPRSSSCRHRDHISFYFIHELKDTTTFKPVTTEIQGEVIEFVKSGESLQARSCLLFTVKVDSVLPYAFVVLT